MVYNRGMRLRCLHGSLLGLSLGLLMTTSARLALASPPPALSIVTGQGTMQADATTARYDFGTRRMSDESPLEHTFTLRNTGTAPVTVDRLQSSCGCTTAFLAGDQNLPLTVGPGGIIPVRVSIAPHRLAPGPMEKSVWVFTHGASDASVLLEVTGTMQDDPDPAAPPIPAPAAPPLAVTSAASAAPQAGQPAPTFALSDAQGKSFSLAAMRGHPAALFFFCGCPWCADVARAWGQAQRKGTVRTLIVFAGTGADAKAFAARNGLNPKQTSLLPDPDSKLTEGVYKLNSCPRAFALDPAGLIRYTNDHADDQPRRAPAGTIVGYMLKAFGSQDK